MRKFINIVLFFRWDSTLNSPNVAKQANCNDCKKYAVYQVIKMKKNNQNILNFCFLPCKVLHVQQDFSFCAIFHKNHALETSANMIFLLPQPSNQVCRCLTEVFSLKLQKISMGLCQGCGQVEKLSSMSSIRAVLKFLKNVGHFCTPYFAQNY